MFEECAVSLLIVEALCAEVDQRHQNQHRQHRKDHPQDVLFLFSEKDQQNAARRRKDRAEICQQTETTESKQKQRIQQQDAVIRIDCDAENDAEAYQADPDDLGASSLLFRRRAAFYDFLLLCFFACLFLFLLIRHVISVALFDRI